MNLENNTIHMTTTIVGVITIALIAILLVAFIRRDVPVWKLIIFARLATAKQFSDLFFKTEWKIPLAKGGSVESDSPLYLGVDADMRVWDIRKLDETGENLIRAAMRQLQLSAHGYHRILKLAWTSADLAESEAIEVEHLAEALQYRPKIMIG